jgi:hypothetical protein
MKKLIYITVLFFYFLFFTFYFYAQQPTEEWVARWPGTLSSSSAGSSIKLDSLGFIYVLADTGNGFGFLKYSVTGALMFSSHYWPGGSYTVGYGLYFDVTKNGDVYIAGIVGTGIVNWIYTVKFNSVGTFQWGKLYNLHNNDQPNDIKVDNSGNIIIVGGSRINSQVFALTIKYNAFGDTLWTKIFNNGRAYAINNIITLDNVNNIFIAGDIENPSETLVMKYNSNGNLNWFNTFTFDSANTCTGLGIALDDINNIYVSGGIAVIVRNHAFLSKLSGTGNVLWSRVSSLSNNGGYGISGPVISSDGSSIYHTSMVTNGTGGSGYSIATLKYNSVGDTQWVRMFTGGVNGVPNMPSGIILDKFDDIYICGHGYFQNTGDDFIILKYNSAGVQQWLTRYTGIVTNGGDYSNDLLIDTALNVYGTGFSIKPNTNYDAVTIKYNQPIGINSNGNELPNNYFLFQNYPNPFNGTTVINYELPFRSNLDLKIYNSLGQLIRTLVKGDQEAGYYSIILNTEDLSSGIYFYQLIVNGNIINTKKLTLIR